MANAADMQAAAAAAIKLSNALVTASQKLVDEAHDRMDASPPTLTLAQYRDLVAHHASIVGNAATIRQTTAVDLGQTAQQSMVGLQNATNELNARMATLAKVQDIVDKAAKVLVAVGSLATLVASPSLMTVGAVVSAVADVAG